MKTILYVDDEAALPGGFPATAEALGYGLVHAENLDLARRMLHEQVIDLVILEPLLGEAGWELLEELARESRDVIVLTRGDRGPDVYGRALELGIQEFHCKPVLRAQLLESLLAIEGRSASAGSPVEPARAGEPAALPGRAGPLSACSVIDLLARLRASGASGVIRLDTTADSLGVELRNGSIVARSRTEAESVDEFLLRTGRLSARDRERLLAASELALASVRDVLIDQRFLTESEVEEAYRERAEERLWVALAWTVGTYRFVSDEVLDPRYSLEIERETGWLLFEAVQKAADGRPFTAWLRSQRNGVVVPAASSAGRFSGRSEKGEMRALFDAISEERTVGELLASGEIGERALYGLVVAGWAECLAEIELIEVEDAALPAPLEPAASVAPAVSASTELALVAAAPAPQPTAGERALEAERWFRDGKAKLALKAYDVAAEAFGMASHLDPGEGEYAAHLGYSLYLAHPADELLEREALEHIARGIKLSPKRDMPYVFLGRIFKAKGNLEMAAKIFRRALKIRPDCHTARQELRLLQLRDAKKGSLLGRLFER